MQDKYPYKIEPLPYSYDALEPYIDSKTMMIHHDKHYQTYIDNLNEALKDYPVIQNKPLIEILATPEEIPLLIRKKVMDNGGGVYNHKVFFNIMGKSNNTTTSIEKDLIKQYGNIDNFKKYFKKAALNRFGSGWAWLVKTYQGELLIITTPNQETPLEFDLIPILPLDVWEHAYYLKYQNKRGEYVDNWFNVINWEKVSKRYEKNEH